MIAPAGGFSPTSRCSRFFVPSASSTVRMPPAMPKAMAKEVPGFSPRSALKCSLPRTAVRAANSRVPPPPAASARSGVMSSSTQKARPCVPATRSLPLIFMSYTGTTGSPPGIRAQCAPSSRLKKMPVSVPTNNSPAAAGSARTTRVISPPGRSPLIACQLRPPSLVRNRYGL